MTSFRFRRTLTFAAAALTSAALALTGCSNTPTTPSETTEASSAVSSTQATDTSASFPVTFQNDDGTTTEIKKKPENILSTTVTVTGTLLAMDAPVKASGSDAKGKWFGQWAKVAEERGVKNLWSAREPNAEAAFAVKPDLIIVSQTGGDSAVKLIDQFKKTGAPVIVVNYSNLTWQALAKKLAPALGLVEKTDKLIADYDAMLQEAKGKITPPSGETNIVSYNGPGKPNPISMKTGPHAQVLEALGFTIEAPNPEWQTNPQPRKDFVFAEYEHLTELKAPNTFVINVDNEGAQKFAKDPNLANLPSVKDGHVYGLGNDTFRVDYYSSKIIIDNVVKNFSK